MPESSPDLNEQLQQATAAIRRQWDARPVVGVILGTGLGRVAEQLAQPVAIPFADVPHFPQSTAVGHQGRLVCGSVDGVPVLAMQGRGHLYEGYSAAQVGLPVRVMRWLGVRTLVVSNAAGALNPQYHVGDLMVTADHINLMWTSPLVGPRNEDFGSAFPNKSTLYDRELIEIARTTAACQGFACHRGVYVGLTGPNYETRAEYRFLRRIGGDVVGMSTVPEVLVAAELGLRTVGLSTITNVCLPDALAKTRGDEVASAAEQAADRLQVLVRAVIKNARDQ